MGETYRAVRDRLEAPGKRDQRERIATAVLQGIISSPMRNPDLDEEQLANCAVLQADALIVALDRRAAHQPYASAPEFADMINPARGQNE